MKILITENFQREERCFRESTERIPSRSIRVVLDEVDVSVAGSGFAPFFGCLVKVIFEIFAEMQRPWLDCIDSLVLGLA